MESAEGPTVGRRLLHLSLSQLVLLNTVVCGLEFCASAAFTYIPPLLLKAGIGEEHMSLILGIGPLLGFFLVPIIGRASDQCTSRYGRRRPFIFGLGCLLILSLMIIPYGEILTNYIFGKTPFSKSIGMCLLIVGAVLLDFSSQAGLNPCEALLSDASRNTDSNQRAFVVYSFMVSAGGCIGYLITALDWNSSALGVFLGGQEQTAFTVLIVLFSITLCATLIVAEEKPLVVACSNEGDFLSTDDHQRIKDKLDHIHQAIVKDKPAFLGPADPGYETSSNHSLTDEYQNLINVQEENEPSPYTATTQNRADSCSGNSGHFFKFFSKRQCNIPLTRWTFTTFEGLCHLIAMKMYKWLPSSIKLLFSVPLVLRRLAVANFCSWTAVMAFNLFYSDYMGQAVYGGNPNAEDGSPLQLRYDEGVRMASWGLLLHCLTAAMYAAVIDRLVKYYSMRLLYALGMLSFSLAMAGMVLIHNVYMVNLMAAMTGFGYATVTTIPFMLVQIYHSDKEIYFFDRSCSSGAGADLATLDSSYFMSQVVLSTCMGYIVYYTGTVLSYVVIAGSVGIVACMGTLRVIYTKQELAVCVRNSRLAPSPSIDV